MMPTFFRVLWWVVVINVVEDDVTSEALLLVERDVKFVKVAEKLGVSIIEVANTINLYPHS